LRNISHIIHIKIALCQISQEVFLCYLQALIRKRRVWEVCLKTDSITSRRRTCTYDDIYRLTQATPAGGVYPAEAYTYDQVGNRLTGVNEQIPTNNETTTYTYDDENRLTGVEITDGSGMRRTYAFAYDPFGRRIKKTVSPSGGTVGRLSEGAGEEATYFYDNQNIILEYNTNKSN